MSVTRRNFLKVNGAVLTLPFMPSLAGELKKGEKPAKKLAMMYIPNGIVRRGFFPGEEEATLPGFVGGFNADKTKNKVRAVLENALDQEYLEFEDDTALLWDAMLNKKDGLSSERIIVSL